MGEKWVKVQVQVRSSQRHNLRTFKLLGAQLSYFLGYDFEENDFLLAATIFIKVEIN